jgi:hypothetical protein
MTDSLKSELPIYNQSEMGLRSEQVFIRDPPPERQMGPRDASPISQQDGKSLDNMHLISERGNY